MVSNVILCRRKLASIPTKDSFMSLTGARLNTLWSETASRRWKLTVRYTGSSYIVLTRAEERSKRRPETGRVRGKDSSRECGQCTHDIRDGRDSALTTSIAGTIRRFEFRGPSVADSCSRTCGIRWFAVGFVRYIAYRSVSKRCDPLLCRMKPYPIVIACVVNRFPSEPGDKPAENG